LILHPLGIQFEKPKTTVFGEVKIRILFVQNGRGIQFFATFNATSTLIEANGAKPCWRLFYAIMCR
jgi:hypothetical protein